MLGLYWRAPSLGVNDWVLIPAENLLSGGGTWLINDTINIDRSNDLIIEAANAEEGLTFQAPDDEPVFEIDSRGQTGDVILRNFTIENVQEGIDIESDDTSEGFVIIDGLSIEGRFNEGGSFDRLDYAIRAEEGRPNLIIVNNTITAPSESSLFGGQGIFVYSNQDS